MAKSHSKKVKISKKPKIRVTALGVIIDQDLIFLSQGYDQVKQQTFYRALGGGVKFWETSIEALKREFKEEINAEITNIKYLGCLENIFIYNGQKGHELIQLYQCDFVDQNFYKLDQLTFREKDREKTALWLKIEDCQIGKYLVLPEDFFNLVSF